MTAKRRRPSAILLLLLLLAILGGTAAVHFAAPPRAPRLGGPHRIERSPLSVVAGEVPVAPGDPVVLPPDPAEVLHPAEVLVTVLRTREDLRAAGARVVLRDPLSSWSGVADERGEVPFADVEAGPCTVLAQCEGYAERRQSALLLEGERNEIGIHLGEAPAVEGRVVSSLDGKPVSGAAIHAVPNPGMDVGETETPSAVSDVAGAFRLRAGATGQALTLRVRAKGFVPGRKYLPLPSKNDEVATVEIALDPTGILSGVVRDTEGKPCPGAVVLAYPAGTDVRLRMWSARPWGTGPGAPLRGDAGPDGRYSVEGLALGGLYLVAACFPGYAPSEEREIFIAAGEPCVRADFDLRARAGVFVKWPVGTKNNEHAAAVTLRDLATGLVTGHPSMGWGDCKFADIAPGRYEVVVLALNAGRKGSAVVEVKVGETAIVEIAFTGPIEGDEFTEAAIEGLVRDGNGAPVPGVKVGAVPVVAEFTGPLSSPHAQGMLFPGRGPVRVSSLAGTGMDGRFRIEGLKEGAEYRLLATARGRATRTESPVRAPASGIEITLTALGSLKGRLVLTGGAGAPRTVDVRVGEPALSDAFRSVATIPFDEGAFDTGDLVPGPCRLCAVAGEFLLPPRDAEVRAGEVLDLGDLPLVRGVMIAGRVVDSEGKPFPKVLVEFRGPVGSRAVSGEDGRFEVGPLPEGEASLSLSIDGEVPLVRTVAAVPGGSVGDLVLPRNGTLVLRATREGGRPWAGEVEIRGAATGDRVYMLGHVDHMGRASFSLPAREYHVVIRDPADRARILAEAPASVAEGAEKKVEIQVGK